MILPSEYAENTTAYVLTTVLFYDKLSTKSY
jgi:hypothetical protein